MVTAVGGALYGWRQAEHDQIVSSGRQAAFAARLAAHQLTTDLASEQATVQQLAGDPSIVPFLTQPKPCTLSFDLLGGADAGHLDLIRPDGSVACSSRAGQVSTGTHPYRDAAWLPRALRSPLVSAPETDPATGWRVLLIAAPVPGHGLVAGFVNLTILAPALSALFSGPSQMEFLILTTDGSTVLARSLDPQRWVGAATAHTPFGRDARAATQRRGLDGVTRLYGRATDESLGWQVFAGVSRAEALRATQNLVRRELLIITIGLLAALIATGVVHRRVTGPIAHLQSTVRSATDTTDPQLVRVHRGPAEVIALGDEFAAMLAAVNRELTERRRAEETARQAEHNYRQLFDINPYPMVVFDSASLHVLAVNHAAAEHYGYSHSDFPRMNLAELYPADEVPAVRAAMAGAGPIDVYGPAPQIKKDGDTILVRVVSHALSFHDRAARCAVMDDITAKEQLERRLRQSQRLESLGELAGGVAHDFNNLLNIVLGYTDFAAEQVNEVAGADPQWQPVQHDLSRVREAAQRASTLARQLLTFARGEAIDLQPVHLNHVVRDVTEMIGPTLGNHIQVHTNLAEELWIVRADPGQLGQVLVNLAVNARDAMPEGGIVVIETDNFIADRPTAAVIPGVGGGQYVRLRVSDTGIGMSKSTIEHAFEPFYTTKPKGKGTGLGLSTTYGIVRQAGGHAYIYSEVGIGTTITILLPTSEAIIEPAPQPPPPAAVQPVAAGGMAVLLVEDEESLRLLMQRILHRSNYQVFAAADGAEAIAFVEAHPHQHIDLLITDVVMPNMSGPQLATRLQTSRPALPVIYISGYPQAVLNAHRTLPTDVALLTKPFAEDALLYSVHHVLRMGQATTTHTRQ